MGLGVGQTVGNREVPELDVIMVQAYRWGQGLEARSFLDPKTVASPAAVCSEQMVQSRVVEAWKGLSEHQTCQAQGYSARTAPSPSPALPARRWLAAPSVRRYRP